MKSDVALNALKVANQLKADTNFGMNQTDYCNLWDHLIVLILFGNACRSEVPALMTIKEFKAAAKDSIGNFWIEFENYKSYVDGPANLAFLTRSF